MIDRVAHTGLSRKVDDDIGLILGKDPVNDGFIGHVAADEGKAAAGAFTLLREGTELFKAVLLEGDLVIIVHAVDADDMNVSPIQKSLAEKAADEPGSAGDKHCLVFKICHRRNIRSLIFIYVIIHQFHPNIKAKVRCLGGTGILIRRRQGRRK